MHSVKLRREAVRLVRIGWSLNRVSNELGVSRSAIRSWRSRPDMLAHRLTDCPRCGDDMAPVPSAAYAHLLGLYLGDGCLSLARRGVFILRVARSDEYPDLMDECAASMAAVHASRIIRVRGEGCTYVQSGWKHWPCLFPQHGRGREHERLIILQAWQQEIVGEHPGRFLRGLFHSDGCRITNWTTRTVAGEVRRYEYPRYFLTNVSADIRGLCCWALGLVGAEHRHPSEHNISVAKRASVAILDACVGPKS